MARCVSLIRSIWRDLIPKFIPSPGQMARTSIPQPYTIGRCTCVTWLHVRRLGSLVIGVCINLMRGAFHNRRKRISMNQAFSMRRLVIWSRIQNPMP